MKEELIAIKEKLTSFEERLCSAGEALGDMALRMQNAGEIPPADLLHQLQSLRDEYDGISTHLGEVTSSLHLPDECREDTLECLNRLTEASLSALNLREADEQLAQNALNIVELVLSIRHKEEIDFPSLTEVHAQAQNLWQAIVESTGEGQHPDVLLLCNGEHPFSYLLELMRIKEDDERYWDILHQVADSFGRPLALATSRNRLYIQLPVEPFEPLPVTVDLNMSGYEGVPPAREVGLENEKALVSQESKPEDQNTDSEISVEEGLEIRTGGDTKLVDEINQLPLADEVPLTELQESGNEEYTEGITGASPLSVSDTSGLPNTLAKDQVIKQALSEVSEDLLTKKKKIPSAFVTQTIGAASVAEDRIMSQVYFVPSYPSSNNAVEATEWSNFFKNVKVQPEPTPIYPFDEILTAQEIARGIDPNDPKSILQQIPDVIWRLVYENRLNLAYYFSVGLQTVGVLDKPFLPPWLLSCLILSPHLRYPHGGIMHYLKQRMSLFDDSTFIEGEAEWNQALRLLLTAAALRPAILTPATGGAGILSALHYEGLEKLYAYSREIITYSSSYSSIDPSALKAAKDDAAWQKEAGALTARVKSWFSQAPLQTNVFAPATRVWQQWVKQKGILYKILEPVRNDDCDRLEVVRKEVQKWTEVDELVVHIENTDRRELGRRLGRDIMARSRNQLVQHALQALSLAQEWIILQDSRPGQKRDFAQQKALEFRQNLWQLQKDVFAELDEVYEKSESLLIKAGIMRCKAAVEDIQILLDPVIQISPDEPPVRHLLNADLVRFSTVPLDEEWEASWGNHGKHLMAQLIAVVVDESVYSWERAVQEREKAGDHEGTQHALNYLESVADPQIDIEALRQSREISIRDFRLTIGQSVSRTRNQIEDAVAFGYLRERERAECIARVTEIESSLPEMLRFYEARESLQKITLLIAERQADEIEGVRQRLQSSPISSDSPTYARIEEVLHRGDALTANEYIQMAINHQALPVVGDEESAFNRFFPPMLQQIEALLNIQDNSKRLDVNRVVKDLRAYSKGVQRSYKIGPLNLFHTSAGQAAQVAGMLETWYTMKKSQATSTALIVTLLSGTGFMNPQVQVTKSGRRSWLTFSCTPLKDRQHCPLSAFGSDTIGVYRILCVWDQPTEEDLINEVGDPYHGSPVIVFYFGRLGEARRRKLAKLSRARRRTFVVLDDILLLYLCGEQSLRLWHFFSCSLPLTFAEPYRITAGLVPPEMFFGRQHEIGSVKDPFGTCFIYGGRQLGKTALLRAVEEDFHDLAEGHLAKWVDLKSEGLGERRPIDDIWPILARELKAWGVVPENVSGQNYDKIATQVKAWLDENKQRRILFLLDEADKFLDSDGKERFTRSAKIKGLVEETGRRFKVVFAGLHNVLRTTKQENHPLAHFGEPICIGPLLENGEMREARKLIEEPMVSAGYVFESPDLVTRILSQTNYYPSLIQLYCSHLLKHVNNPQSPRFERTFDLRLGPPYVITTRDVDEAMRSQNLLQAIRDRFMWTLQLDARYEIIAYAIAYGFIEDTEIESGNIKGFPLSWIRKEVLKYWSEGFADDASENSFQVLLEEMVGLGILRTTTADQYTLRSPNVVSLMGTRDDIENALLRAREAPPEYEAATFRSALRKPSGLIDSIRRNPLTDRQESELRRWENGVSVIVGCEAAGLSDVGTFLESGSEKEFFISLDPECEKPDFEKSLNDLSRREKDGTTILLIPHTCGWDESWVKDAVQKIHYLDRVREARAVNPRFVRILFLADPLLTWKMDWATVEGVSIVPLHPWQDAALRQWLDDCGYTVEKSLRDQITTVTGNWPSLLYRLVQPLNKNTDWRSACVEEMNSLFSDREARSGFMSEFGLGIAVAGKVLSDMAVLGEPLSEPDLAGVSATSATLISHTFKWADRLNLIKPVRENRWELDQVVKHILLVNGE
jgi:hypothetical protein